MIEISNSTISSNAGPDKDAIIALAEAVQANAEAISHIAHAISSAGPSYGIYINGPLTECDEDGIAAPTETAIN